MHAQHDQLKLKADPRSLSLRLKSRIEPNR